MRALVTGAGGFVGRRLSEALVEAGWEVTAASPELGAPWVEPRMAGAVQWLRTDVRNADDVALAMDSEPDVIFHLAGVTFIPGAQDDPGLACEVNVVGVTRLLGEVRRRKRAGTLDPLVIVVGSAEQYGRHPESELPLTETARQQPLNVYAATKAAQEVMALEAYRSEGVRVLVTRSFNHSGGGQSEHFLLPALVRR